MYLNEATLLHNIKLRYSKDKIYVSTIFKLKSKADLFCLDRLTWPIF